MSYPIRLSDQLKQHLRALRKSRELTQAQLGALVGVKQARMAEIEANPGAVSLDQLAKVLAALGGTLHLHTAETAGLSGTRIASPIPTAQRRPVAESAKKVSAKKSAERPPTRSSQGAAPALARRGAATAAKPAQRTNVVIRAKKGAW